MKNYAECEQEITGRILQLSKRLDSDMMPVDRLARHTGFLKELAVNLMYENELLRDQSNTREMHQLLERLGGQMRNSRRQSFLSKGL